MSKLTNNSDYTEFDSHTYYSLFHSQLHSPYMPKDQITTLLDTLSEIYNSGNVTGSTLLDFGTGPTIYNLVSAARHFPNIYLSDFSENNRNALWRWLNKDSDSYDFSHFFEYLIEKEQLRCSLEEFQGDMRNRVRGILRCDMTHGNPLYPSIFPKFDVISTSLCLSVEPSKTMSGYEAAVRNLSSLLKPGGWVVYIDALGCSYYKFGLLHYDTTSLTKMGVIECWKTVGFDIESWEEFNTENETKKSSETSNLASIFCMTCRKRI